MCKWTVSSPDGCWIMQSPWGTWGIYPIYKNILELVSSGQRGHRFGVEHNALSLWWISSKKRGIHQNNRTDVFLLPFCNHRWLENKEAEERGLQIWPHITICVTETIKKPKSKISALGSFTLLRSTVQDGLITAKLKFFAPRAAIMKPYLQIFQPDAPLLPFITSVKEVLLEILIGKFLKREEHQAVDTTLKIAKLDVLEIANHVAASEIGVKFAAADTLAKALKEKSSVSCRLLNSEKGGKQCMPQLLLRFKRGTLLSTILLGSW